MAICTEILKKFIRKLTLNEDTSAVLQQAFGEIAELYNIGRICFDFSADRSFFTSVEVKKSIILFDKNAEIKEEAEYKTEIYTVETTSIKFYVYTLLSAPEMTQEEKSDIQTLLEIISFHLGKEGLINFIKFNKLREPMTGLPNSNGFLKYAKELYGKNELSKYNAYYFNLKAFGLVNRQFGTDETDNIIIRYAQELQKFIIDGECVGRLGGDNFVALIFKERTHEFLKELSGVGTYGIKAGEKNEILIKAAAGVWELDNKLTECEQIIGFCSLALNIAKNVENKPYVFVTEDIINRSFREKQIYSKFFAAIKNKEFKVYYQPKVETDNYTIIGAEALVRWEMNGAIVGPRDFISILEKDNSICALDFYMFEEVCKDINRWIEQGIEPVKVSVNFSRRHLVNPNLAEDIMDIVRKYKIDSQYIEIEITETVDEMEKDLLNEFVHDMENYKIAIAIDDFGAGASSLNLLRSFKANVLKIDKSFIDDGIKTESDRIVLANIVKMAKELNMDVITEGVETWEQVKLLHDINCNLVQGFLFDKPMPGEKFESKIKNKKYSIEEVKDYLD